MKTAIRQILINVKELREKQDIVNCCGCDLDIECKGVKFQDCPFSSLKNVTRELNYINNGVLK